MTPAEEKRRAQMFQKVISVFAQFNASAREKAEVCKMLERHFQWQRYD